MSKPVGSSVASLIEAARGDTAVVKSAVDALRELAKQPYKSADVAPASERPPSSKPSQG
jgi:hypothetical protein